MISSRTYLDRLSNAPDLVENAKRIKGPVLFIRGNQEPKENYPAEDFAKNCPGPCEVAIVPNCDHFYVGAEDKVSKIVTEWLKKTLGEWLHTGVMQGLNVGRVNEVQPDDPDPIF